MNQTGPFSKPGTYFTLRQANPARFRKLYTQSYCLLHVLEGAKGIYRADGSQLQVRTGDLVLFRAGESLTFENRPTRREPYRAEGISYREDLVESVAAGLPRLNHPGNTEHRHLPCQGDVKAAFNLAKQALLQSDIPPTVVENRVREVLLWVAHAGIRLVLDRERTLGERVRRLIVADLEHRWRVGEVARKLAVSEATLRRRLADEGQSFSEILMDARLSHALDLLMTTDKPVTEVSYTAGFGSPSTFSQRFRDRFDLTPREIRLPSAQVDRIQTETDRHPKAAEGAHP